MLFERSFAILRTNPKLTTNVKIVVDSSQNLYLESYQTSKQLSEDRFRHYEIKDTDYLFDKLPEFWLGVEATVAFGPRNQSDYDAMYDDFVQQFDDIYYSGSAATEDTWYVEENEYIAPLWVKKDALPKAFIVLRVDGPGLSDGNSPYNFRSEILDKWKIISYFDITENNKLGAFIRKQLNHSFFPETPTVINHEELRFSIFSGIDFYKTGYAQKSLDFDPIKSLNTRIFQLEENITNFWRDLGLIFPNILNLKFLFDDTPATPTTLRTWSINRYMGFYLDEIEEVKSISPYKPFNLKKTPNEVLETLLPAEVAELPYVLNNSIVRDVAGRRYTFDPIEGDWKDDQTYWIEWNGKYYKLSREVNDSVTIIGQYQYKIIADVNITYSAPVDVTNPDLIQQYSKVLLNELSTLKFQIEIIDNLVFENISAQNVIRNVNSTFTTLNRLFQQYLVNGQLVWGFRIELESDIDNNLFTIDDFNSADLYYIEINGMKSLIKQYAVNIPNIGGLFYLQTDYAVRVTARAAEQWINNGIVSKDTKYYSFQDIETVVIDQNPIFYKIYKAAFTDVKDFDFDRLDTNFTQYEYEKNDTLHNTLEPKLYAKERRPLGITLYQPIEINSINFTNDLFRSYLSSNPDNYQQWLNQYTEAIQRSPISPEVLPVRLYFDDFEKYVDFKYTSIITGTTYYVNGIAYTENLNTYKAKLPLYIFPKRQAVLDVNNNPATDPTTGEKLYQLDINGDFIYTTDSALQKVVIPNNREYYREEGYIYLQSDVDPIQTIDFYAKKEPEIFKPTLTWNNDFPMATSMRWSPYKKSIEDPNQQLDPMYVPVSSEYITSEEIWEIRNDSNLSPIWDKNQNICKWGFMNSIDTHDYAYRLNYDLEVGGIYNNSCNPFNQLDFAARRFRDLDFFYRLGIDSNFQSLNYLSLHLKEPFYDLDKHFNNEFDYFDYVFHSDYLTINGIRVYKKYSLFDFGDASEGAFTLFKGIKWRIYDVANVFFDDNYEGEQFVEDYERINSSYYNGYKFSIILGKKLSTFEYLNGDNDGDFGIDIIVNEKYKNILMFIYFETDETVTFGKTLTNGDIVQFNLETSEIDLLYEADQITTESVDSLLWQNGQLKINGSQDIGDVRIRDLKLFNILAILNEKNYQPVNGSGRRPVRYVRITADNEVSIMSTADTDFIIEAELPEEFLIKERTFVTRTSQPHNLDVNNSVKNTIILDDDPNAINGDPTRNSLGVLVNTVLDLNAWDGMPVGRNFIESDVNDTRFFYQLDENIDPTIYRHSGPYSPIFKDMNLFRPISYWTLTESNISPSTVFSSAKNWKFYDDFSDNQSTGPNVYSWGYLPEIIFSKVNREGNILKLALDGDTKTKSIYPMVDEYGYDFGARYIFQSTWDRNFFLESRTIILAKNEYPNLAGYTVFLDGFNDRLKINDNIKFNIVPTSYSATSTIEVGDNLTLTGIQTEISLSNLNAAKETRFYLTDISISEKSSQYFFIPNGITPATTNIVIDSFITSVIFIPNNINATSIKIQSTKALKYEPFFYENDASNFNGHNYLLNRENDGDNLIFASTQLTVQPVNGQILFELNTNTRGKIEYNYYIPNNVPREKFLKEFSIQKFIDDSNAFLMPDYTITNVTGDIYNLSFKLTATLAGAAYNFTVENLTNAVENTIMHVNVPLETDYVEKGVTSVLQYAGQNFNLTQFSNKAIRSFTIEFWIKSDGFNKDFETIIYKGSEDINSSTIVDDFSYIIRRHNDTGKLEFVTQSYVISDDQDLTTIVPYDAVNQTGTPVYINTLVSNTEIDDNQNHHVAFVFDSINKKKYIYVDQYLDAIVENQNLTNIVVDPDPNIEDKDWPLLIGADYQNGVLNFRGSLDELRVWNYARSVEQIQSNYNLRVTPTSYLDPFRSLIAYYRFDEQVGTLEIIDYSEAIFQLERINIASQNVTINGLQTITETAEKFLQNEVSFFTKSPIRVTDVEIEWLVSGADIKGVSDERYTVSLPVPTTKTTITDLPKVITPRSKFTGVFEPSITPAPRPVPPAPPNPVKVVEIDDNLITRPKPLRLKKLKRINPFLSVSARPEKKRVFSFLDKFNRKIVFLKERNNEDDRVRLFERDDILNRKPLQFLNNATPISNNAQQKRVTFSQNKPTGITTTFKALVFKPINNLLRRL